MTLSVQPRSLSTEALAESFFRRTSGRWKSVRRYYALSRDTTQEVTSWITVEYLEAGCDRLLDLARRHEFEDETALICGSYVTWESHYETSTRKPSRGATVFGVKGDYLYRDRGFSTPKPVRADFGFTNPDTMWLRSFYNNSQFDEEIKLVGEKYRTRQTIMTKENEQVFIGQYLESRLG